MTLDPPTHGDRALERQIDACRRRLVAAGHRAPEAPALARQLAALIRMRSPAQVARMERDRCLT